MRRKQDGRWAAPIAAGVFGFAFAFGGVYLNAVTGSKVEAKPATAEPEDPVVLLQRALLNDSASMAEARERLRRLLVVDVPPPPVQADVADRRPAPGAPGAVTLSNVDFLSPAQPKNGPRPRNGQELGRG